jgi:hypothetical protein
MMQLPFAVRSRLQAAHLTPALIALIQEECDQHGYLLHPTAILGTGGFGTVFLAEDAAGETVAIKVSVPRPGMEALFVPMGEEEGRKACQLTDVPEIAAGIAWWFASQAPVFFLVSRYVHGENLQTYRTRHPGRIPEARLCAWTRQLMQGLLAMHQRGLVHRDVKPENILWERATDRVYLTDLGIAKYSTQGTLEALRSTGTYPYAPLEQMLGHATAKSDQYALGIVLFELATGTRALPPRPAPRFGYPLARPKRLLPRQDAPALSDGCAALIERLAALASADRFPSMRAALAALERLGMEQARTRPLRLPSLQPEATTTSAPARPRFVWQPHRHLAHLVTGRPLVQSGPAFSRAGTTGLLLLYLAWLAVGQLTGLTLWQALTGQAVNPLWGQVGLLAGLLWRMARTWHVPALHRRGSLTSGQRRGLLAAVLGALVVVAGYGIALELGAPALLLPASWLSCFCAGGAWLLVYGCIEVGVN